jgi:hypothetical protein
MAERQSSRVVCVEMGEVRSSQGGVDGEYSEPDWEDWHRDAAEDAYEAAFDRRWFAAGGAAGAAPESEPKSDED